MAAKPFENPLIRNVRLREMYTTMVAARLLSRQISRQSKRGYAGFAAGHEACWVATAIDLQPGDLTSAPGVGPLLSFVRSPERAQAKSLDATLRGEGDAAQFATDLPSSDRLWVTIGAALALRAAGQRGVVLAYASADDLKPTEWKRLLRSAAEAEAPVIFVILPATDLSGDLSRTATTCGVPGIPVDASDAIAIYRVAQESIVRARADNKPALIEAVPFVAPALKSARGKKSADPIKLLGEQLVAKRVSTPAWLSKVELQCSQLLERLLAKV